MLQVAGGGCHFKEGLQGLEEDKECEELLNLFFLLSLQEMKCYVNAQMREWSSNSHI